MPANIERLDQVSSLTALTNSAPRRRHLRSELQLVLSTKINDLSFSRQAKMYCAKYGAVYIAEVYQLRQWKGSSRAEFEEFFDTCDLPPTGNPIALGWKPPYWDLADFSELLQYPVEQVYPEGAREIEDHRKAGRCSVAQILLWVQNTGRMHHLKKLQRNFSRMRRKKKAPMPHACMYVPDDWDQRKT